MRQELSEQHTMFQPAINQLVKIGTNRSDNFNFEKYSYNVELNYDKDTYILIYKTLSINHKVRDIDIHEIRKHCINVMKSWELCDFKNKELKYYNKLKNIEKDFND